MCELSRYKYSTIPYYLRKLECTNAYSAQHRRCSRRSMSSSANTELFVHVDCKGLPPSLPFLRSLLSDLAARGADGVLIEYEDMFPYENTLFSLQRAGAYSREDVSGIVACCNALGLEVVPLVQCLGHMEFALKHEQYAHLRQDPDEFSTICPAHPETRLLVGEMICQVLALHPTSQRVHLGCDEPVGILTCNTNPLTAAAAAAAADAAEATAAAGTVGDAGGSSEQVEGGGGSGGSRSSCSSSSPGFATVLMDHIVHCAGVVRSSLARTPLVWHDAAMAVAAQSDTHLHRILASGVSCVCWDYTPTLSPPVLAFAARLAAAAAFGAEPSNRRCYVATAFKGADGCDALVPHLADRAANQRRWADWCAGALPPPSAAVGDARVGLTVFLTGWSRYGHLMPLTEPLPAALPALWDAMRMWRPDIVRAGGVGSGGGSSPTLSETAPTAESRGLDPSDVEGLCADLQTLRQRVASLEEERRVSTAPATARQPAPALKRRLTAQSDELVTRLTALGGLVRVALAPFLAQPDADGEEWLAANVQALLARSAALSFKDPLLSSHCRFD